MNTKNGKYLLHTYISQINDVKFDSNIHSDIYDMINANDECFFRAGNFNTNYTKDDLSKLSEVQLYNGVFSTCSILIWANLFDQKIKTYLKAGANKNLFNLSTTVTLEETFPNPISITDNLWEPLANFGIDFGIGNGYSGARFELSLFFRLDRDELLAKATKINSIKEIPIVYYFDVYDRSLHDGTKTGEEKTTLDKLSNLKYLGRHSFKELEDGLSSNH